MSDSEEKDQKAVDLERLRNSIPLNSLSDNNLASLAQDSKIVSLGKGKVVFKEGDSDTLSIYILEGAIELDSKATGAKRTISADSDEASYALAQLRPRQYTGKTTCKSRVALIDSLQIDRYLTMDHITENWDTDDISADGMEVDEMFFEVDGEWMMDMMRGSVFDKLPASSMNEIFSRLESVPVKAGEVIIKQGEAGDYYYIIKSGKFNISRKMSDGKVHVLATMKDGDIFGEEALLSNAPRNANVISMEEGELMRLSKADFDDLLKEPLVASLPIQNAEAEIKSGAILIDVRTMLEFKNGALKVAKNIPLNELRRTLPKLDTDKKYLLCCLTSGRSQVAAFIMNQRGFDAHYLEGGLQALPSWPSPGKG